MSDQTATIRDLFYPWVGLYNHLAGGRIRFGIWSDGQFAWLDGPGWTQEIRAERGDLAHAGLGIRLTFEDDVHAEEPVFRRRWKLTNDGDEREFRFFVAPDLRIAESDIGDTAMVYPELQAMVHFKRDMWFAFHAATPQGGMARWSTGYKQFKEFVGTWLDAEDGELSGKPIEQGSVDSVFAVHFRVGSGQQESIDFRIVAGMNREDMVARFNGVGLDWVREPLPALEGTDDLGVDLADFVQESLRLVLTQCDELGAILAANDGDILLENRATYSYCWPRDGAYVAATLVRAGQFEVAKRYFEFCAPLLTPEQPVFHQKYGPDGTVGATWHPYIVDGEPVLPFQQDETSLTIWALGVYAAAQPDDPLLPEFFLHLVERPMEFMLDYVDCDGLPQPSWDLWEERRGVHAHTVAATVAGFRAAATMAERWGSEEQVSAWRAAADRMLTAWNEHGWNAERSCYFRMLTPTADGYAGDATLDSAILAFDDLGLAAEMPNFEKAFLTLQDGLRVRTPVDGYARYEKDYYFRQTEDAPGNPWIICTMWVARAEARRGNWAAAEDWLRWAQKWAHPSGVLSEQLHPLTGQPLSVSPLTWSHAEVLETALLVLRRDE